MKLKIIFILILAVNFVVGCKKTPEKTAVNDQLYTVAHNLDYVARDYVNAVSVTGQILNNDEYKEQLEFIEKAEEAVMQDTPYMRKFSLQSRQQVKNELHQLLEKIQRKEAPPVVQKAASDIYGQLRTLFGLTLAPIRTVEKENAPKQYQQFCASCHGEDGRAQTTVAKNATPPPISFYDEARMNATSPKSAYLALTLGVQGTLMAPMTTQMPSDQERWEMAFYVTGLRYKIPDDKTLSKEKIRETAQGFDDLTTLIENSDEQLIQKLTQRGVTGPLQQAVIRYLRTERIFEITIEPPLKSDSLKKAKEALAQVLYAIEHGQWEQAESLTKNQFYLQGIEPVEKLMKWKSKTQIEHDKDKLVAAIKSHDQKQALQLQAAIKADLEAIDKQVAARLSTFWGGMISALAITLREGLEILLLITALLMFLRKNGHAEKTHLVHVGWVLALLAGAATFVLLKLVFFDRIQGLGRLSELIEGILTVSAVALLIFMTHFVFGAKQARSWVKFLNRQVQKVGVNKQVAENAVGVVGVFAVISGSLSLVGLSFFAIYRETLEIIIFFQGIVTNGGSYSAIALAVAMGTPIICITAIIFNKMGKRFNPQLALKISSFILGMMCVLMIGKAINAFQEGSYLRKSLVTIGGWTPPSLEWLEQVGIFFNWQAILAQLIVLLIVILPSIVIWSKKKNSPRN